MKILHIATDEKFIDHAIPIFERAYPNANDVVIFSRSLDLKHVKTKPKKVKVVSRANLSGAKLDGFFYDNYDAVVFHSFDDILYPEIFNIPDQKPTIWLGWGYDYYDYVMDPSETLLEHSLKLSRRLNKTSLRRVLINVRKLLLQLLMFPNTKKKAIEKLSVFSPVLPGEHELVSRALEWKSFPVYCRWNYGTLEDNFIKGFERSIIDGDSVLVGNSASATCNHIESFELLRSLGVEGRKIVVPLSYGDKRYGEEVVNLGKLYFGSDFEPLLKFMKVEDYVSLIKKCGFVVMNHKRQQAVGNIVIMLYLGARVFVREESPVFDFMRKLGVVFSTVQELEGNQDLLNTPLTLQSRKTNRKIVSEYWSRCSAVRQTERLVRKALTMKS
ncbi:MAG: 4-alpha-L-fucosyltransferase (Fuc4NAc transferase) [Halomonadaceae bacterium]|nr:4-alpha-L-fucosyltransferase (Fuc4NAc transferase) [Halomonadaceae bacterium]